MEGSVDEVADGLTAMSVDELADAVARGAAEQAAHLAWWLSLVAEFSRRNAHLEFGMVSCAQWLSWRCGLDLRTAREHVRVAGKLPELSLVRTELAEGRLSYSKVRALTRVANESNEALLVSLAGDLSASQLERILKHYEVLAGAPLTQHDDDVRRTQCGVTRWVDSSGLVHHEIVSAPEEAGLLDAALAFGADSVHAAGKAPVAAAPVVRVSFARRQLDALLFVTRRGLINAARDDLVDSSRYLVMLHVREGQAMVTDEGRVDLGNGLAITPRTLQRLGCGALVQAMLHGVDGNPLDLGDLARLADRKQRLALKALYPTCDVGGCDVPFDWCEVHHVIPWDPGGRTDMDNLRPRCSRHHHLVHEGGWREIRDVKGRTVLLPPGDRGSIAHAPAVTAMPVAAEALVASNRARGVTPPRDLSTLGGAAMGESLSGFGEVMILDALLALSPPPDGDLADLAAARGVDDVLQAGAGASPPLG